MSNNKPVAQKPASSEAPTNDAKPLDAFLVNTYTDKQTNTEKKAYRQCGSLVPHKKGGGFTLHVYEGMAVFGEIAIFPRTDKGSDAASNDA
jgi:hypothetical protein